jgi:hypothetical protein
MQESSMEKLTMPSVRVPRPALAAGAGVCGLLALAAVIVPGLPLRCAPAPPAVRLPAAPPPLTNAQILLRRAARERFLARRATMAEIESVESWDPRAAATIDPEAMRLDTMARDKGGHLRRARDLAYEAETAARTGEEARAALLLQVIAEHELGRHDLELRRAAVLRDLAPNDYQIRAIYRRVQRCQERPLSP